MPDTTTPDPLHRCIRGPRCNATTLEDGERRPAATSRPDTVCDTCAESIHLAVADLPDTWLHLHANIGDHNHRTGQRVTTSRSAPININTDIDALKTSIVEWLVIAAARIADHLNTTAPRPANNTDTEHLRVVQAATQLITPHTELLIDLPEDDVVIWRTDTDYAGESIPHVTNTGHRVYVPNVEVTAQTGLQIALQLHDLRRRARKLLALTSPQDKLSTPCPGCNQIELHRRHEKPADRREIDQIDCGNCGLSWPYERYRHLCLIWVKEDEMEREKLQQQLDEEREKRQLAEWLLAKRNWQLTLGLECPDVPASEFARTILDEPTPEPDPDELMTDRDIANVVGVADSTVRSWATRGHITRHTADDGSTLYNAHEVWEYAKSAAGGRNATTRRLTTERAANEGTSA